MNYRNKKCQKRGQNYFCALLKLFNKLIEIGTNCQNSLKIILAVCIQSAQFVKIYFFIPTYLV